MPTVFNAFKGIPTDADQVMGWIMQNVPCFTGPILEKGRAK